MIIAAALVVPAACTGGGAGTVKGAAPAAGPASGSASTGMTASTAGPGSTSVGAEGTAASTGPDPWQAPTSALVLTPTSAAGQSISTSLSMTSPAPTATPASTVTQTATRPAQTAAASSTTRGSTATPAPTAPPTTSAKPPAPVASGADVLSGTKCQIFPNDNAWHSDISKLPLAKQGAAWLASMGAASRTLHPDFGPSYGEAPVPYGIPITIAPAGTKRVPVRFDYDAESDRIAYPLTAATLIEGGSNSDGDRHAIVVTADTCELFETYDSRQTATGWTAGSGAHWSLASDVLRPAGWTSADAAGLPILPGLLRWSEVKAGAVHHAIRFTTSRTAAAYVWPARHQAGSGSVASYPPMGARFRLKASFALPGFSSSAQVILRAMQTYGLILADNGSPWFFQGDADPGWPPSLIAELKKIPANAFEAVDTSSLMMSADSGRSR